ncbi:MAG: hypothetical protein ACREMB_16405 [Candidatus Rokuibacteriota bacterium]
MDRTPTGRIDPIITKGSALSTGAAPRVARERSAGDLSQPPQPDVVPGRELERALEGRARLRALAQTEVTPPDAGMQAVPVWPVLERVPEAGQRLPEATEVVEAPADARLDRRELRRRLSEERREAAGGRLERHQRLGVLLLVEEGGPEADGRVEVVRPPVEGGAKRLRRQVRAPQPETAPAEAALQTFLRRSTPPRRRVGTGTTRSSSS